MFQNILAVALLFLTSVTFAQNLEAILSGTKLPVPIKGMPVVYDGEDSIYILGGDGPNGYQQDILKFSVTTQTLEKVGTMDPVAYGSAVWTGNRNILYFGGNIVGTVQSKVWSFKPEGWSSWAETGELPRVAGYTASVWDQGSYSYTFGGMGVVYLNTISRYSSATNASVVVGQLPSPRAATSAVWNEGTGDAYIFGGYTSGGNALYDIVKYNPAEDTVVKLNVTLPSWAYYSCAIWTGTEAYIGPKYGDIVRFNPSTKEVVNVHVNNLPTYLRQHACAFVKKLNRIYFFGGVDGGSRKDDIMYIDLGPSPTNPTTTTPITTTTTTPIIPTITTPTTTERPGYPADCNYEVDGTRFPDPYCCKSFYQCENQEAIPRQCPSQLHFNPSHGECDIPEIVGCRSTYI